MRSPKNTCRTIVETEFKRLGKPWTELKQTSVNRQRLDVVNALPRMKVQMATSYIDRKGLERLTCNDNWSPKKNSYSDKSSFFQLFAATKSSGLLFAPSRKLQPSYSSKDLFICQSIAITTFPRLHHKAGATKILRREIECLDRRKSVPKSR